jgi:hypothetical protein
VRKAARDDALEAAYPGVTFRPHTRGWLARFLRAPAECVHLKEGEPFMAALSPDMLYLRGKAVAQRTPPRPEASLCCACLVGVLEPELADFEGRGVMFEPDPQHFTQYFFVGTADFAAAGLQPEVAEAIEKRLHGHPRETCEWDVLCERRSRWLWFSHQEVGSLDETAWITGARGLRLCGRHAARKLCHRLETLPAANIEYLNLPYGEAGAYLWI